MTPDVMVDQSCGQRSPLTRPGHTARMGYPATGPQSRGAELDAQNHKPKPKAGALWKKMKSPSSPPPDCLN